MKIYKTLLPIIVGIGLPAIVVPTTLSVALNQKTQLSAVDITTVIPNNANIGVFTSQPTANEVIARLKQNYSTLYDNQIQCSSPTTTSATITPVTGSDIYSGTTNVVFNMTPTSTNSLLSFFGLSLSGGSYDVTTNQNWLPTSTPSFEELLSKLSGLTVSGTSINLNQLEIKTGTVTNWVSTDDCYELTIGAKTNTNFYNNTTDRVVLKFNKSRTIVDGTSTGNFTTTISGLSSVPKDASDVQESLRLANLSLGWYSGIFGNNNTVWSWTNPTTLSPNFSFIGNESYTTKTGTYQQTISTVSLTLTLRGIALDTLITKTNPTSNTYLAYDFKPVELDIKYACEQGGCDGAGPFSFSWSEISISIAYVDGSKTGTATLTATQYAVSYQGSVSLTFNWAN